MQYLAICDSCHMEYEVMPGDAPLDTWECDRCGVPTCEECDNVTSDNDDDFHHCDLCYNKLGSGGPDL